MPRPATITARTTYVGVSKLAREADLSQGYTSRLLKQDRSPQQIIEHQRQRKGTRAKQQHIVATNGQSDCLETYASAQTRKEIAMANLRELEVLERRGELVPIAQVSVWLGGCVNKARDVWVGLRDLADRIRQEPDVVSAQQLIDAEIRRGLEELEKFGELLAETVTART